MLPTSLFERITHAFGLKSSTNPRERRAGVRVDLRTRAYACMVTGTCASTASLVRTREISQTGMSVIHPHRVRVGQELLIRLSARDGTRFWLWCRCRRCHGADHLCNLLGLTIMRVLYPGQDIRLGTELTRLTWLDVEGDAVAEDPFASAA